MRHLQSSNPIIAFQLWREQTHQDNGNVAPYAGIYRCVVCGEEIGIAQGHTLPPQNHHQHPAGPGRIEWQLIMQAHGH